MWGSTSGNNDKARRDRIAERVRKGEGMPGSGGKMPEKNRGKDACALTLFVGLGALGVGAATTAGNIWAVISWVA